MTPVHTPKQVSADELLALVQRHFTDTRHRLFYHDEAGTHVSADMAAFCRALTRRSSAGVKDCIAAIQAERDKPIEGPEHGAWDRGRRDGLSEAMRILSALEHVNETPKTEHVEGDVYSPSHAGEDDEAVAWVPVSLDGRVFWNDISTVEQDLDQWLFDGFKVKPLFFAPTSVPPQGETSREASIVRMAEVLDGCLHFKDGNSLVWATRLYDAALASQTQGEGEVVEALYFAIEQHVKSTISGNVNAAIITNRLRTVIRKALTPSPTLETHHSVPSTSSTGQDQ